MTDAAKNIISLVYANAHMEASTVVKDRTAFASILLQLRRHGSRV
jgi:hypothetical protein